MGTTCCLEMCQVQVTAHIMRSLICYRVIVVIQPKTNVVVIISALGPGMSWVQGSVVLQAPTVEDEHANT